MFNSYAKNHLKPVPTGNRSIRESIDRLFESALDFSYSSAATNIAYTQKIGETLQESDGLYGDDVKSIMIESCVQLSSEVYSYVQKMFEEYSGVQKRMADRLAEIAKANKEVVQKYEPLLKQLDTSKSTYSAYQYTPDGLPIADIIARLTRGIDNVLCNGDKPDDINVLQGHTEAARKDIRGCFNKVKAIILGIPDSLDVARDFYTIAQRSVVDFNVRETKYFSGEVFNFLRDVTDDFNVDEVSAILALIETNLEDAREMKKDLDKTGEEYANCVKTQYLLCKTYLMSNGLLMLMELLSMKLSLVETISIDYRQVIINVYESLLRVSLNNPANPDSTFSPREDISTQILRLEAGVDVELF